MNIQAILNDWNNGLTHGEIIRKYDLPYYKEYAITECSKGLTVKQIQERIKQLSPSDSSKQIWTIMRGN